MELEIVDVIHANVANAHWGDCVSGAWVTRLARSSSAETKVQQGVDVGWPWLERVVTAHDCSLGHRQTREQRCVLCAQRWAPGAMQPWLIRTAHCGGCI